MERRRLRGDLIEVYKIMRGMDKAKAHSLFPSVEDSKTRGHRLKVRGKRFEGPQGQTFHSEGSLYLERAAKGSYRGGNT